MSGSGLNSLYISTVDLEEYFVSNQNAQALAGGKVYFYVDSNRTQPKQIFELVQASGFPYNYSYVPLPNPITLSNSGTPLDANGNNVAIYYYPYDKYGNVQLYYVEAWDAFGNLQFTREAWPFPYAGTGGGGGGAVSGVGLNNMLTNPQFVQVLFTPAVPLVINFSGSSTTTVNFAPGWDINITHVGAGSVTLTQTAVAGTAAYPYNPPYTLTVTAGANVTQLTLSQTLSQNPDWAAPQTTGVMGYLSGSILLASGTGVSLDYAPSNGNPTQTIFTATNNSGVYVQESGTVQLLPANNNQTAPTANDKIIINLLNTTGVSTISNVQVIPLTTNATGVQYDQTPVNRQYDQMFNYYNPKLQYKPIPSYLVGWDFPLNPAQFLGSSVAAQAVGINKSYYVWDQTILYQSANSGITTSRGSNGELVLTAAVNTQIAVIQYLSGAQVNEILNSRLSVNVEAKTNKTAGYTATVSLWYTAGSALPSCVVSNLSIVGALSLTGYPTTFNQPTGGTWAPIPRSGLGNTAGATGGGDAQFIIHPSSTTQFNEYGFNGWDLQGISATQTATFFAIVLGTETITAGDSISINSISLVAGDIPTRPAPQTPALALADCQYYYEKSYDINTLPGTPNTGNNCITPGQITVADGAHINVYPTHFTITYKATKEEHFPVVTIYSVASGTPGTVQVDLFINGVGTVVDQPLANFWTAADGGDNSYTFEPINGTSLLSAASAAAFGDGFLQIQYVIDSRLAR